MLYAFYYAALSSWTALLPNASTPFFGVLMEELLFIPVSSSLQPIAYHRARHIVGTMLVEPMDGYGAGTLALPKHMWLVR